MPELAARGVVIVRPGVEFRLDAPLLPQKAAEP
jgi:hypothetical protein